MRNERSMDVCVTVEINKNWEDAITVMLALVLALAPQSMVVVIEKSKLKGFQSQRRC